MAKIWSHLLGRVEPPQQEARLTLADAAEMYASANEFGYLRQGTYNNKTEGMSNDFIGFVNGAYKASGVVFAVCLTRMLVFSEMRFMYQKLVDGRPGDMFPDDSLDILEHPWPNGTTGDLLSRAIQDTDMAGNHYVVHEGGRLRRLRPDWVEIILSEAPDKAVGSDVVGYLYKPGGTANKDLWKIYPVDGSNGAVAHWAPIPDPEAQYRGMSWLTPVIRDIAQDRAATSHKLKFFENAATPNLAVSFKETVTAEQFKDFMRQMDEQKGGVEHAYETLYLGGGADVTVIGSQIDQLDFKGTQGLSETRIAAAGRVHPAIVGLSEGLSGSTLNEGNYKAARNGFADGTMRPLWRSLCAAYEVLVDDIEDARLWYDTRDIEFLRQDQKEISDIMGRNAQTITQLVMQGYTPESAVEAVEKEDLRLLKHTGLYSVQLQPPGTLGKAALDGQTNLPKEQQDEVDKILKQAKQTTKQTDDKPKPKPAKEG